MASNSIFVLSGAPVPWGDYGKVLTHGLVDSNGEWSCVEPLRRRILFPKPGNVFVNRSLRDELHKSGLTGLAFRPVRMRHVVGLDWSSWDTTSPKPPSVPPSAEPEGYVLGSPHDPDAAARIGDFWALAPPAFGVAHSELSRGRPRKLVFHVAMKKAEEVPDFFQPEGVWHMMISARAHDWLANTVQSEVLLEKAIVDAN